MHFPSRMLFSQSFICGKDNKEKPLTPITYVIWTITCANTMYISAAVVKDQAGKILKTCAGEPLSVREQEGLLCT